MSGFERSSDPESHDAPDWSGRPWPNDFTQVEKRLARSLHDVYPIEQGEFPPRYAQTLLDEVEASLDDEMRAPLSKSDIMRMTYNVKRRVGVRTPLFTRQWAFSVLTEQFSVESLSAALKRAGRPIVTMMTLLIVFMLGSVFFTSPSFAQGLRLLLGETGVQQVAHYPRSVTAEKRGTTPKGQEPSMPTFWLGTSLGNYVYQGMRTLAPEQYSHGSIVDLQYVLSERTPHQTGSGVIDIREFQISDALSAVLQSVQEGSTTSTSVNGLPAVYVDGMWVVTQGQRTVWQKGARSMLIFERDGVIFWIVGDQRDGVGQAQLTQVASHMVPVSMMSLMESDLLSVRLIGAQLSSSLRNPIGYNTELLKVIPRDVSPDTAVGEFVSQGQPLQSSQSLLN